MSSLSQAQTKREETLLLEAIDKELSIRLSAKTVGPHARVKLRHLLAYYAKKPHPFRACVRDNMKRFGPGRTEAVCATLKDIIRGTTKWRKGRGHKLSEDQELPPDIDDEVLELLESMSEMDVEEIIASGRAAVEGN